MNEHPETQAVQRIQKGRVVFELPAVDVRALAEFPICYHHGAGFAEQHQRDVD